MKCYVVPTLQRLLDIVGASGPDPKDPGPVVVEARLEDGRIMQAAYYKGPKWENPDAESDYDFFIDVEPLRPLVVRLLETGESFVTLTGGDDMVCCLEWSMKPTA